MSNSDTVELTIPADLKFLNIVSLALGGLLEHAEIIPNERQDSTYNVQLAVHEICTNIIEHAYDNDASKRIRIQMSLDSSGAGITICLTETSGRKFEPKAVPIPDAENLQVRGFGLFLVEQLMDKVDYQHQASLNRWILSKKFK